MLQDRDRIFHQSLRLRRLAPRGRACARRLGRHERRWSKRASDWIINEMKASGLRGRGGAGFPTRHQMVVHAQARPGPTVLPRGQRRRIRARYLQGSRDHAQRSALLLEGCLIACVAMGAHVLHLHPRRVRPGEATASRRRSTRPTTPALVGRQRPRLARSTSTSTAAPARTSAARKPRCSSRSRAKRACRA